MDAELAALEQRRDKTRVLKQGMMQELLTRKDAAGMSAARCAINFLDWLGCRRVEL